MYYMVSRRKDFTGMRFGKLTVIKFHHSQNTTNGTKSFWVCRCDCGKEVVVRTDCFTSGNTRSCGCLHKDIAQEKFDNRTKSKLYHVYYGIKQRCENPNHHSYKNYGGRGIKVSNEWDTWESFRNWALENGYKENCNLSIERIDVNGDYSPDNCKWIKIPLQSKNTRRTLHLEYNGKVMCLCDWAKELKVNQNTLYHWIQHKHMTIEDVINSKCNDYPIGSREAIDTSLEAGSRQ